MTARELKVGRIKVKIPGGASVLEERDLDELYGASTGKPDALIVLDCGGRIVAALIEDTGRPEPRDFERLSKAEDDLKGKGLLERNARVLRVLHHTGLKSARVHLVRLARAYKVELQECRGKAADLEEILRRRGLFP